jgi:hypothetical protein
MKKAILFLIVSFLMLTIGAGTCVAFFGFIALPFSGAYLICKLTPMT